MKIERLPLGVYQTNCYLVGDEKSDKAFIVDPAGDYDKIAQVINKAGYDLEYVILTHGHGDHIGAVNELKTHFNAKVMIHQEDKEMLLDPTLNMSGRMGAEVSINPDEVLKDGDELKVGTLSLKIIHTPGHTKGSACILVDGVLFSGDTLFFNSIGRTDLYGGDGNKILKSISNKLMILPENTVVYPGHGRQTTIKNEIEKNPFF